MSVDLSIIQIDCDLKTKYNKIQGEIDKLKSYAAVDDNFENCTDVQQKMIDFVNKAQKSLEDMINNKLSALKETKELILNVQNCIAMTDQDKEGFFSGALDKASDILDGKFLDGVFNYIEDIKKALIDESKDVCDYFQDNADKLNSSLNKAVNVAVAASVELDATLQVKDKAQQFIGKIAKAASIINCLNEATIKNPKLAKLTSALEPELNETINVAASVPNKAEAMKHSIDKLKKATGVVDKLKSLI